MTAEIGPEEALAKIADAKERNIRFVELQFTDIMGIVKGVTIPLHQLEGSLKNGTWFDGSSIEGFTRIAESDQWLKPDMSTFAEIPWQRGDGEQGPGTLGSRGTARVICDVYTPGGDPFVGDPRGVLRRQLERAKAMGYVWNAGPELEFFLFRKDEQGRIQPLPHDQAGYFDFSSDLAQNVRRDMVNAMRAVAARARAGLVMPEDIDETSLRGFLTTNILPDPDLVIRTGGEKRLSEVIRAGGFGQVRRAAETPFNMVLEARP